MRESNEPNPNRAPWGTAAAKPGSYGTSANPAPYGAPDAGDQAFNGKKRGWGCWVWGCFGVMVFGVLAIVGISFATYSVYTAQVDKYTDTQPAELPIVEMQADELETLEKRIESFTNQVRPSTESSTGAESAAGAEPATHAETIADESAKPGADAVEGESTSDQGAADQDAADQDAAEPQTRELVLTAKEINGLIAANPDMRGRLFIQIKNGVVSGQVSFPTDLIPGASGRFFNADAEFDVSLDDGVLVVRLTDASVKGEPIPRKLLDGLSQENLAKGLYDDPENAEMLRKFESIQVVDESIVLRLKERKVTPEPEVDSEADPPAGSVE